MSVTDVQQIVKSFMERLDEVVERGVGAIWDNVPSYARTNEEFRAEVGRAMRINVEVLSQVLSEGRVISPSELRYIERVGQQRAEMGIPLEDVLHAYRSVLRACWDVLSEECRANGRLDATIEVAEALFRYTDQISTAVADAYARAQLAIVREQEGARREFLADLLFGTEIASEDILRRAHTFGYDLSLSYAALVGCGPKNLEGKETTVAAAAGATLADGRVEPIVLQKGEHTIALIPVDPTTDPIAMPEKLVAELDGEWSFGMGGPEPGLKGIRRAYLEAKEALEIGDALGMGGPVYRFDDLLLYHFVRVEPALVERFIDQTLGPLIEYDERRKGELIKTIEAYFSVDGSVKMAGEALFAHPHTVTYRLKQVESLTGWSLRDAEDKLRLQLALRAYRLAQARNDPDEG
jgi:hypothetical protein